MNHRENFLYTNGRITYFSFISFEIGEGTSVLSIMVVFLGLHCFFLAFEGLEKADFRQFLS